LISLSFTRDAATETQVNFLRKAFRLHSNLVRFRSFEHIMTDAQRSLANKYLAYRVFSNLWFISALWLFFYRLYITDQQIGLLDGLAFAVGLLAEVPSGALADRYGRDRLVKIGQVLTGTGMIVQAFGTSFPSLLIGWMVVMIGVAFTSGADEALFFSKLNFEKSSTEWRKLLTRGLQLSLIGGMAATLIGGWLYSFNPKIPWIFTGLSFLVSIIFVWPLKDNRTKKQQLNITSEISSYISEITFGFKAFLSKELRMYLPLIVVVQGLFYATGWGLLRLVLLDRYHFDVFGSSIVITASRIMTIVLLAAMHKHAHKVKEKSIVTIISVSALVGLLVSLADIGVIGAFVIFILYAGEHLMHPFMSEILNNNTHENQRATVLSIASFLKTLPYVALAPTIGYLNTIGKLEYFLIGWSGLIVIALYLYLSLKKRDETIMLPAE